MSSKLLSYLLKNVCAKIFENEDMLVLFYCVKVSGECTCTFGSQREYVVHSNLNRKKIFQNLVIFYFTFYFQESFEYFQDLNGRGYRPKTFF